MGATVLVFCLDGLDHQYLDQFRDVTPTIHRIAAEGSLTTLNSTFPPFTPSAWPSFYTGTPPGRHGVSSFFTFDGYPDDASIVSLNSVDAPTLWEYLAERGRQTLSLELPVTHPAPRQGGVFIPGYLSPSDTATTPRGLYDEFTSLTGRPYRTYQPEDAAPSQWFPERVRQVETAAASLLSERSFDLALVCVQATDTVFHVSDDVSVHEAVYEAADELVSNLATVANPEYVFVCSDHGMQLTEGYTIRVNQLLHKAGLLETTYGDPPPTLAGGLSTLRADTESTDATEATVDWNASKAFLRTPTECGVRINLNGREPDDVVAPTAYEEIRDKIIELLSSLRLPTGKTAFERVARREEYYGDEAHGALPDIIAEPEEMAHSLSASVGRDQTVAGPTRHMTHRSEGVLVSDELGLPEACSLVDIAPTILSLLDEPIPRRMCGDPLFSSSAQRVPYDLSVDRGQDHSLDDAVRSRLDELGYL